MTAEMTIAVFDGDGIGPEVMAPTIALLRRLARTSNAVSFSFEHLPAGAAHFQRTGAALPAESLDTAKNADAILLSAMGLPSIRYDDGTEISPQIDLRKELGLYAGLRPIRITQPALSPIRGIDGHTVDCMLIRESTEGLFWSAARGEVSEDAARETLQITRGVSEKLFAYAFRLAARRRDAGRSRGRVTCVDKANVFRSFAYFRALFEAEAAKHPDIEANGAYVDATAMRLVQSPWDFDVMVTENMFGDILSDLGAGIMGGLGLAPSADIGDAHAVFQPCHGSAPDIAGSGTANPLAMFLSAAMMLEWLGQERERPEIARMGAQLQNAVDTVVNDGTTLTPDLGGTATTESVALAVEAALDSDPS